MLICLNGQFLDAEAAQLSINDSGFLYGDTLFETFKAHNSKILDTKEHLDRLEISARLLDFPCDRQQIESALQQLAEKLTASTSRIRLTLSRGCQQGLMHPASDQGWFLLTATAASALKDVDRERGAACVSAPNQRVNPLNHLPQMKRGNYADCLYAANFARQKGAREALFIDQQSNVLEGCTSNIFAVIDGTLITPPLGALILAGVMRQQVMQAATQLGLANAERQLPYTSLLQAEEVFLSNSMIDILPVSHVDGHPIKRGETWRALLKKIQARIEA